MVQSEYTRRGALGTLGLCMAGVMASSTAAAATTRTIPEGKRPDERIQFIEADPAAGFNYPYLLATPDTFRSEPVPMLVTMNSAREGIPLTAEGPDKPPTVAQRARTQIQVFKQVGPWVSEQLGVPQLVPVFPLPDGDPVDNTHKTLLLDRETMLIEGTDLERIDRQLLRMTQHARQEVLSEHQMHDQLLFWGNSFGGVAAEHMAVLHPEETMAFAGAGINGIATLPLEEVGDHSLKYPVGVADLEDITGEPFNAEAFDEVNKYYIQGGRDTHNRLKFFEDREEEVTQTKVWNDPEVYATAKAVYGPDMVEDRMPRCHIAFEKAEISGQFRVYPEMTHDPEPAGPDVLEFLRRSIKGENVSDFGQRFHLPFNRTIDLDTENPSTGDPLQFAISGKYPPPEGLVTYNWDVDDGQSSSGRSAEFTFKESGDYDVKLALQTAHGQSGQLGISLLGDGSAFAAMQYAVKSPGPRYLASATEFVVGESISIDIEVTNVGGVSGERTLELLVDGNTVSTQKVNLDPSASTTAPFNYTFDEIGDFELQIPPAYFEAISVEPEPTSTPESVGTPTETQSLTDREPTTIRTSTPGQPGLGVLSTIAGIGASVFYLVSRNGTGQNRSSELAWK